MRRMKLGMHTAGGAMMWMTAAVLAMAAIGAPIARAGTDIDAKAADVVKSLVIVDFTLTNPNLSHQESGQGILIGKDGTVLIAGALINEGYPMEWVKDIKVRLPGKNFAPVPAKFLGRTKNRIFAFLKLDKPVDAPVFDPGDIAPAKLGQQIFSIGMQGKSGGYATYVGVSHVKAIIDLNHTYVFTAAFALTNATSPVFDDESGKLAGITIPAVAEDMVLRVGRDFQSVSLTDEEQSNAFVPADVIAPLFKNIPTKPFVIPEPWLGATEITGLEEDVKMLKKIDQPAAVTIGSVIPDQPAAKAGLEEQDIVLTIDGKQFSKSPVAGFMPLQFSEAIDKHSPGDVITLGILRDGKKMAIKVKLGTAPKAAAEMPLAYSTRIGIITRDLVFADAYTRKLPQDTKGVMVALVKQGSPANLGSTPLKAGYLITKVDDQPVDNQKQFLAAMKHVDENAKEVVFVVILPTGDTQVCHVDLTK